MAGRLYREERRKDVGPGRGSRKAKKGSRCGKEI